jgi:hypothetical protein
LEIPVSALPSRGLLDIPKDQDAANEGQRPEGNPLCGCGDNHAYPLQDQAIFVNIGAGFCGPRLPIPGFYGMLGSRTDFRRA